MRLKDKIAIVTGGASGFGKGIVEKFIQQGAKVVIADVNIELAESVAKELGSDARAVKVDVSKKEDLTPPRSQTVRYIKKKLNDTCDQ